ncbi:MAG: type II toxin-antitoxin system RelE/ParE family toxin [Candidatus Jettenia sp.]|uniref:Plasmid stabilization system protein n=1 Tax=Candidatus Jettenia caeni TaxID=247490 RepID=I3IKA0_9BACT|nr:type II toxin-antitoxin system RelE/ParE family toxin [Candidatus Jettenia sp. AMX1]MBC6929958.1 type II toxin-antitoxin system RelE/ParE family toxin [Candidatus Jettenia sp.]NUN23643.1 type II toxin-antitoxin system RelE/ParE family toxin [Candidatus Jettenia caeni]KAA0248507.1 MAG: type II toxin-antitoxin system RelE/ParE family toxin [Candidatus Jettenia sp. AMX1]MCE7881588.1 type II toxin-antitoxin system RelE/ParE family toxin [Candidatus Jettenia sp. AMX1]MCQ3928210.1 type II toxin-a
MDLEVKWSPEATEDLESIAEYIARDSQFYARSVVTEMLAVSRHIREFPLIGRIVPEIGDERIRERFIYSYRMVYRIEPTRILIVAVIHGKRPLESISERFESGT